DLVIPASVAVAVNRSRVEVRIVVPVMVQVTIDGDLLLAQPFHVLFLKPVLRDAVLLLQHRHSLLQKLVLLELPVSLFAELVNTLLLLRNQLLLLLLAQTSLLLFALSLFLLPLRPFL